PLLAVVVQALVDELAAGVTIQPEQRHGQALAHAMHPAAHALVPLAPDRLELDPGGGDVHRAERTEVKTLRAASTVRDEIDLEESGPASSHSVKVRMEISWRSQVPTRVVVAPRGDRVAR